MATMSWGTPVQYRKIKSYSAKELQTTTHQVGKIYTITSSYTRMSLMSQTVTREQFDKMVKEVSEKLKGKARILSAKIDSTAKTFTYQYTPIASFEPITIIILATIFIIGVLLLIYLVVTGADLGELISKSVTAPLAKGITDIFTSPWVIGGLLVAGGGYFLLKNPSKIGEIRREFRRGTTT